jgi:hypothetical protein
MWPLAALDKIPGVRPRYITDKGNQFIVKKSNISLLYMD